jgi:hypothetical protein
VINIGASLVPSVLSWIEDVTDFREIAGVNVYVLATTNPAYAYAVKRTLKSDALVVYTGTSTLEAIETFFETRNSKLVALKCGGILAMRSTVLSRLYKDNVGNPGDILRHFCPEVYDKLMSTRVKAGEKTRKFRHRDVGPEHVKDVDAERIVACFVDFQKVQIGIGVGSELVKTSREQRFKNCVDFERYHYVQQPIDICAMYKNERCFPSTKARFLTVISVNNGGVVEGEKDYTQKELFMGVLNATYHSAVYPYVCHPYNAMPKGKYIFPCVAPLKQVYDFSLDKTKVKGVEFVGEVIDDPSVEMASSMARHLAVSSIAQSAHDPSVSLSGGVVNTTVVTNQSPRNDDSPQSVAPQQPTQATINVQQPVDQGDDDPDAMYANGGEM